MTDAERSSIPRSVHDAAGAWLARRQAGADPNGERAFLAWLDADPRHRAAYDEAARAWRDSELLADSKVGRSRKLVRAPFLMRHSTHVGAVSLGVAAILGVGTLATVRHAGPFDLVSAADAATYRTAVGEIRTVRLADGSTLTLDTSTLVRVRFTPDRRRLELAEGRARFSVAQDRRSFTVAVSGGEIVAHQTVFDVSVIGSEPTVAAIEGDIALQKEGRDGGVATQSLVAGEASSMGADAVPRARSLAEARWVSGMVALDKTPLGTAVAAINRYNHRQVQLGDPALAILSVTGAFRARDPQQFAQAIATMFGLAVDASHPDRLILHPSPKKSPATRK
ncbi:FecR family protein [Sphingobium sp. ba1]|jgi:transmembrane sensor|uniref:FecR family protein n=1 Tax=Sphingobium sp. ba1 TaxID=1522072 RepID=UPI00055AF4BF|nr:FecR domain-containing protein [Sphingobium sp. ba1]